MFASIYTCFLPLSMTGEGGANDPAFSMDLTRSRAIFRNPEILYNPSNLLYLSGRSWFQFSIWAAAQPRPRCGKSNHISMISNSITHRRSYTNSTITDIAAKISTETAREHRCRRAECRCLRINSRYLRFEWWVFECFMMFHNLLRVFHYVSQCFMKFHDISQCFTSVSWCFTTSKNVLRCLVSHAMIGITDRAAADQFRDRDNGSGIGNNSAGIGRDTAGIVNITAKVIPC